MTTRRGRTSSSSAGGGSDPPTATRRRTDGGPSSTARGDQPTTTIQENPDLPVSSHPPEERDRLDQQQDETVNGVPRPPGAEDVSTHDRGSRP